MSIDKATWDFESIDIMNASYSPVDDDDREEEYLRHLLVHIEKKCHTHHGEVNEKTRLIDCEGGSDASSESDMEDSPVKEEHCDGSSDTLCVDSNPLEATCGGEVGDGSDRQSNNDDTENASNYLSDSGEVQELSDATLSEPLEKSENFDAVEVSQSCGDAPCPELAHDDSTSYLAKNTPATDNPPIEASEEHTDDASVRPPPPPPKPPKPVFNFKRDMAKPPSTNPFDMPEDTRDTKNTNPFAAESTNPFAAAAEAPPPAASSGKSLRSLFAPPTRTTQVEVLLLFVLRMMFDRKSTKHFYSHCSLWGFIET